MTASPSSGPRRPGEPSPFDPVMVGPYRLIQRIGEGGMGVVHLALDGDGRAVALKVLRADLARDPDARSRLAREVSSLRRVRHPRVADVIDADVVGETPYLVTQFVPGKTLDDFVRDHGPLPPERICAVGLALADALAALHRAGVVHRDVKPANVMLLDGEPILIDFGIAHLADESRMTQTGLVMGTPGYLSPEVVGGQPVTPATDWWGWGATLAFAASGRAPFGTGPIEVVLDRVRRADHDLKGVSDGLRPVLAAALSSDPSLRPAPESLLTSLRAAARAHADALARRGAPTQILRTDGTAPGAVTDLVPPPAGRTEVVPPPAGRTEVVPPPAGPTEVVDLPGTRRMDAAAAQTTRVPPPPHPPLPPRGNTLPPVRPLPTSLRPVSPPPVAPLPPPVAPTSTTVPPPPPAPLSYQDVRGQDVRGQDVRGQDSYRSPDGPGGAATAGAAPSPDAAVARWRRYVLPLLFVVLVSVAAVAPGGAVVLVVLMSVLARVVDRTRAGLADRRRRLGPRSTDVVMGVLALPWRIVVAALATLLAGLLPTLIGCSTIFLVALAAGGGGSPVPNSSGPLAVGTAAGIAALWWGPGGASMRRGTHVLVAAATPSRRAVQILAALLGLVLLAALLTAASGAAPDWGGIQPPPFIADQLSVR